VRRRIIWKIASWSLSPFVGPWFTAAKVATGADPYGACQAECAPAVVACYQGAGSVYAHLSPPPPPPSPPRSPSPTFAASVPSLSSLLRPPSSFATPSLELVQRCAQPSTCSEVRCVASTSPSSASVLVLTSTFPDSSYLTQCGSSPSFPPFLSLSPPVSIQSRRTERFRRNLRRWTALPVRWSNLQFRSAFPSLLFFLPERLLSPVTVSRMTDGSRATTGDDGERLIRRETTKGNLQKKVPFASSSLPTTASSAFSWSMDRLVLIAPLSHRCVIFSSHRCRNVD
jgi:hypothetical protein